MLNWLRRSLHLEKSNLEKSNLEKNTKDTMEKNKPLDKSRLGRGLSSLIPPSAKAPVADRLARSEPAPSAPTEAPSPPPASDAGVLNLLIEKIVANAYQPRTAFDEAALQELTASVLIHGVLQPVMVRPRGGGRYELIAGERRYRAAQQAGLTEIPAVVRAMTDEESLTVALIENIQREDLNAMEAARGYRQLLDQFGVTQTELARQIGKAQPTIANALGLLRLPMEMQESIAAGQISMEHGKALLSVLSSERRLSLWQEMVSQGLTVAESRRRAAESAAPARPRPGKGVSAVKISAASAEDDIHNKAMEDRLRSALGLKVTIRSQPEGGGEVIIRYANWDDMETIIDRITG